jgi:hypothetical protein
LEVKQKSPYLCRPLRGKKGSTQTQFFTAGKPDNSKGKKGRLTTSSAKEKEAFHFF